MDPGPKRQPPSCRQTVNSQHDEESTEAHLIGSRLMDCLTGSSEDAAKLCNFMDYNSAREHAHEPFPPSIQRLQKIGNTSADPAHPSWDPLRSRFGPPNTSLCSSDMKQQMQLSTSLSFNQADLPITRIDGGLGVSGGSRMVTVGGQGASSRSMSASSFPVAATERAASPSQMRSNQEQQTGSSRHPNQPFVPFRATLSGNYSRRGSSQAIATTVENDSGMSHTDVKTDSNMSQIIGSDEEMALILPFARKLASAKSYSDVASKPPTGTIVVRNGSTGGDGYPLGGRSVYSSAFPSLDGKEEEDRARVSHSSLSSRKSCPIGPSSKRQSSSDSSQSSRYGLDTFDDSFDSGLNSARVSLSDTAGGNVNSQRPVTMDSGTTSDLVFLDGNSLVDYISKDKFESIVDAQKNDFRKNVTTATTGMDGGDEIDDQNGGLRLLNQAMVDGGIRPPASFKEVSRRKNAKVADAADTGKSNVRLSSTGSIDGFSWNNKNVRRANKAARVAVAASPQKDARNNFMKKGNVNNLPQNVVTGKLFQDDVAELLAESVNTRFSVLNSVNAANNKILKENSGMSGFESGTVGHGGASDRGQNGAGANVILNNKSGPRSRSATRETAYINNDLNCPPPSANNLNSSTPVEKCNNFEIISGGNMMRGSGSNMEVGDERGGAIGGASRGSRGRGGGGRRFSRNMDATDGGSGRHFELIDNLRYYLDPVLSICLSWIKLSALWLMALILDVAHQLSEVVLHFAKQSYFRIRTASSRTLYWATERCHSVWTWFALGGWKFWRKSGNLEGSSPGSQGFGLDKKIVLPDTGEEAMIRLLSCKGQDAYCILGLPSNCSDEDIRRYYRKQAFLVHPDKNQQYGADEAFKILAHAFELIGVPARRQEYDIQNLHRTKAMKEFDDMLNKLKEKMEEALNTMNCECGEKHRRYQTKRELSDARYCRRCGEYHSVRDGDIWAESKWFGFLWYFYACVDSGVYDITEWAGCQKNNLKHMKANVHQIQYRLITGRNRGGQPQPNPQHNPATGGARSPVITDADMDEFLRHLGGLASAAAGANQTSGTGIGSGPASLGVRSGGVGTGPSSFAGASNSNSGSTNHSPPGPDNCRSTATGSGSGFSPSAYKSGIVGSGLTGDSVTPSNGSSPPTNFQYHPPTADTNQPRGKKGPRRRKPRR